MSTEKLRAVRKGFINGVSDPNLNSMMDDLQSDDYGRAISPREVNEVKAKAVLEDKATCLIDMVLKKGDDACGKMISVLGKVDPHVFNNLRLEGHVPVAPPQSGNRLTEADWRSTLLDILYELEEGELKRVRIMMRVPADLKPIPRGKLEKAEREEMVDLMVENWGFHHSVRATQEFMKKLPRNDEAVTSKLNPYLEYIGFK